jgi:hypothetical protein
MFPILNGKKSLEFPTKISFEFNHKKHINFPKKPPNLPYTKTYHTQNLTKPNYFPPSIISPKQKATSQTKTYGLIFFAAQSARASRFLSLSPKRCEIERATKTTDVSAVFCAFRPEFIIQRCIFVCKIVFFAKNKYFFQCKFVGIGDPIDILTIENYDNKVKKYLGFSEKF